MVAKDGHDNKPGSLIDSGRRRFLVALSSFMGGIGAIYAAIPFLSSWMPSARAQAAGAPVEVDLSEMLPGEKRIVEWRGKPVWIIRRSSDDIVRLKKAEHLAQLRDPNSAVTEQQPDYVNALHRAIHEDYLILVGICTHLGCSPTYRPYLDQLGDDWPGGFFCPCHGSTFDLAGRVFKGVPAPINLEVPPHMFINDHTVIIGKDTTGKAV
ncbi:MAG: ubiquinol-cytochrome c reductase iron-sulfur subunit [Legionellales bacterium]|nr:ubiquinol-cytochrome c reductase iron-sulfur subunit [Legionellales bacterium]